MFIMSKVSNNQEIYNKSVTSSCWSHCCSLMMILIMWQTQLNPDESIGIEQKRLNSTLHAFYRHNIKHRGAWENDRVSRHYLLGLIRSRKCAWQKSVLDLMVLLLMQVKVVKWCTICFSSFSIIWPKKLKFQHLKCLCTAYRRQQLMNERDDEGGDDEDLEQGGDADTWDWWKVAGLRWRQKLIYKDERTKVDLRDLICLHIFTLQHSAWTKNLFWIILVSLSLSVARCPLMWHPTISHDGLDFGQCKPYFPFLIKHLTHIKPNMPF